MKGKHILLIFMIVWLAFCLYFGLKTAEAYVKLLDERAEIYEIR